MHIPSRQVLLPLFAILVLVTATYSNHVHNQFHFDDFHTVTTNPYIRDLRNIPLIFADADTFSTLPANRGWRPLVTASLAIDYAIAHGLKPAYFQASDFFWFLVQLCLMFALFRHILDFARPDAASEPRATDTGGLRAVSEPRATDTGGLRAVSESRATDTGGLRAASEPRATDTGGLRASSESRATDTGGLRASSEPRATDTGGLRAASESRATDTGGLRAVSESRATDTGGLRAVSESRATDTGGLRAENRYIALFATALYGVHPAIAETVNYIIQRGDIYSTLAVVAGLLVYIRWPHRRSQGLYLIPVALGLLSKPPALVFPAILYAYLLLFEDEGPLHAITRCVPSLLLSIGFGALAAAMTPKSYDPGAWPAHDYRITQPLVALRYFRSFFLPLHLNADTDHIAETSIWHGYAWLGILFVLALIAAAIYCGRRRILRPIAFGIYWYILALLPTSIFPLAEIENDHRMYFPFVGLVLSLVYGSALIIRPREAAAPGRRDAAKIESTMPAGPGLARPASSPPATSGVVETAVPQPMASAASAAPTPAVYTPLARIAIAIACGLVLAVAAHGTRLRNVVWHDEETLWYDVTLKSPQNGRGLMNYGLTQMEKGDYVRALSYFTRALEFSPDYYVLEINLGIANGALNNDDEAERHFARSIELAPQDAQALYFYASWLRDRKRYSEAIQYLNTNIEYNPAYLDSRYLLMWIYHDLGDTFDLDRTAHDLLAQFPTDSVAQTWLAGKTPPAE